MTIRKCKCCTVVVLLALQMIEATLDPLATFWNNTNAVYGRVGSDPLVQFLGAFNSRQDCAAECVRRGKGDCAVYTWHSANFPSPEVRCHCYGLASYFDWYPTQQPDVVSGRVQWACDSVDDCSRNGACTTGQRCECRVGWTGHACQQLDVAPVERQRMGFRSREDGHNVSTWGGAILPLGASGKNFAMIASEITNQCGMSSWCPNSQVVLALSGRNTSVDAGGNDNDAAAGPYAKSTVLFHHFSHEPSVAVDAHDGRIAMFFTARRPATRQLCTSCADGVTMGPCEGATQQCCPDTDATWLTIAKSVHGPWTEPVVVLNGTGSDTNLSPLILANGSLIAVWRSFAPTTSHPWFGSKLHLLTATKWDDPATYRPHADVNIFPTLGSPTNFGGAEDPFLWQDSRDGVFHVVLHNMYGCNTGIGSRPCGTHGWSHDGWTWNLSGTGAYGPFVEFDDGTVFAAHARERPHLLLGGEGNSTPTHLVTGFVYDRDASFTLVQPIHKTSPKRRR